MAATLTEQIAVDPAGPDKFVSRVNPGKMGNAANIAYGGCAIGIAIQAAYQTVGPAYLLYTVMGNYLGPAFIDRKLLCSVRRLRDTRTFATRQIELSQELDDGSVRICMSVLADFQVKEKASMLEFSAPPMQKYSPVEKSTETMELVSTMVEKGVLRKELAGMYRTNFGMKVRFMETRLCPEGVPAQNLMGMAKSGTSQDHLPLTSKTWADWTRVRHPTSGPSDKFAALGFIMDEALSFLPLTLSNRPLYDAGACSSLDFALRFFTSEFDLSQWNFREMNTVAGRDGRTYSEARFWDSKGNMIADMTQQSIMRPKPGEGIIKASL